MYLHEYLHSTCKIIYCIWFFLWNLYCTCSWGRCVVAEGMYIHMYVQDDTRKQEKWNYEKCYLLYDFKKYNFYSEQWPNDMVLSFSILISSVLVNYIKCCIHEHFVKENMSTFMYYVWAEMIKNKSVIWKL